MAQPLENPPKPAVKGKLVMPENILKKKVGNGGFDESVLVKAQTMLENNDIDFRPIATELIGVLNSVLADIKAGTVKDSDMNDNIMYPVMQLKAQGTLFHYPLITKISHAMVDLLETVTVPDKDVLEIVEAYSKTITAVSALQLKSDKVKAGQDLFQALSDACDRYYKLKNKN